MDTAATTPDPRLCDAAGRPLPYERMTPKQRRLADRLHIAQMRAARTVKPRVDTAAFDANLRARRAAARQDAS